MTLGFTARTLAGATTLTLAAPLPLTDDPRVASADFSLDELLCLACEQDRAEAGSSWRVVATREMARHGSSALDTAVTVRLLLPLDCDEDPQLLASQAMMRLALAMASPEQGLGEDPRFTGPVR